MSDDDYQGSFTWNLSSENGKLKEFLECECKQSLNSDTFNIGKLPFSLEVYPNGDQESNNGSFMLYVTLLSMPDNYKQITFNLRLYCKETNSSFTSIAMFTSQRNSAGWSQDTVKLSEINDIDNLKQLSIGCNINILEIIDNDNQMTYQYKNPSQASSPFTFKWNVDTNLINKFKDCRVGKSFESDIYNNMWCLRCLPNGKRSTDEGNVKLYLLLCSLPNINTNNNNNDDDEDAIHIQYTLWNDETGAGYNGTIVLNYEYSTVGWPNKILLTPKLNDCSSLTFNAEIEILRKKQNKENNDSSDSDSDDTYSSSSSLDYGVKGVIAEDDPYDDYDEEEKLTELDKDTVINNTSTPQYPKDDTNDNDKLSPPEQEYRELSPPQVTPADVIGHQQDVAEVLASNNEEIQTPKSETPPADTKDIDDMKQDEAIKDKKKKKKKKKNKKKLTLEEFKAVSLEDLIENDIGILDNYDLARKICKFFDSQFDDTDTVCVVAEAGKQPSISYWVKGQYVRKHQNIYGKNIMVYRACKHTEAKEPIVTKSKFESFVKKISMENENRGVNYIADEMDNKFGDGCHYARSTTKKPQYDIYCRFSDKYECGFKLPSGSYVIAWRR